MKCEGFTRPACEPCPNTENVERVKVDSAGTTEKKYLCPHCVSQLLNPAIGAWEYD